MVLNSSEMDPFLRMRASHRSGWRLESSRDISELIEAFETIPTTVFVEVKLVGFDSSPSGGIHIDSHSLASHLSGLQRAMHAVVLQPQLRHLVRVGNRRRGLNRMADRAPASDDPAHRRVRGHSRRAGADQPSESRTGSGLQLRELEAQPQPTRGPVDQLQVRGKAIND